MVENGGKSVKESVQKSEKTVHLFVKNKQYNKYENWQNIGKETAKNWENNQWKNLWKKQQNNQWKKGKCVGKNGKNIVKEIGKKIGEKISK